MALTVLLLKSKDDTSGIEGRYHQVDVGLMINHTVLNTNDQIDHIVVMIDGIPVDNNFWIVLHILRGM